MKCSIRTEGHPGGGIRRAAISDAVGVFGSGRRRQRGGNLKPAISCIKSTYRVANINRLTRALDTLYLSHGTGICDEVEYVICIIERDLLKASPMAECITWIGKAKLATCVRRKYLATAVCSIANLWKRYPLLYWVIILAYYTGG